MSDVVPPFRQDPTVEVLADICIFHHVDQSRVIHLSASQITAGNGDTDALIFSGDTDCSTVERHTYAAGNPVSVPPDVSAAPVLLAVHFQTDGRVDTQ